MKPFGTAADKCSDVDMSKKDIKGELAKCQDYDAGDYINEQLCSGLTASFFDWTPSECNDKRKEEEEWCSQRWWMVVGIKLLGRGAF